MNHLSVQNLRIAFPGAARPAVDGVSFTVQAGRCLGIVGESGSGKSLTARALLGMVPADGRVTADELVVAGVDTASFDERDWRGLRGSRVGLVAQDALVALDPLRRIGREVAEPIEVHAPRQSRADTHQQVLDALIAAAMPDPAERARQYPHELSGGLRQRALIASALAAGPGLLLADEPTTALDTTVQAQILALLGWLKASGLTLVLISHDLSVVADLADEVAVMKDGMIVEQGLTATVFGSPQHPYTRSLLAAVPSGRAGAVGPAPADARVVLSARGLSRSYRRPGAGDVRAVADVSFDLHAGETVGIVGESGSGKSTVARMLLGTERPDAGTVLLDGQPWSSLGESARRPRRGLIQLIHQNPLGAFDPRWSVRKILGEATALADAGRGSPRQRIAELLNQVGLSPELATRRPHQLSGGQQQRVAIARALARRPQILVCDEPVSALDVSIQAQVLRLLTRLQQETGMAMVFISHDLGVIGQVSDRILVMHDGAVVEAADAATVLTAPEHPFTRRLLASAHSTSGRLSSG